MAVKEAVFPFAAPGVDLLLGPEMKSTGEGDGHGSRLRRGFRQVAARSGYRAARQGHGVRLDARRDLPRSTLPGACANWASMLPATRGTAAALEAAGIAVTPSKRCTRPTARRRHDQERRGRHADQHH